MEIYEVKDNNKICRSYYLFYTTKLTINYLFDKNVYKIVTSYLNELYTNKKNIKNNFAQSEVGQKK